ncbi:MAG: choice-of-anchor L domain-containing protein [Gemmobacter sp.]|nr:choice-of-anchor L domain-containing protein [Gemmobacter sp.]
MSDCILRRDGECMAVGSELGYDTSASALTMANTIFGDGVAVIRASYTGDRDSSAVFSRGDSRSPDVTPSDTGVILSTGRVRDFTQSNGDPNRSNSTTTDTDGIDNNSMFNALAGVRTYDAAWLDVDFIPTTSQMTMQFVFASEEYPEYINSIYNDVVGVWVNGQHAPLALGTGQISVNNLNAVNNPNIFVSNANDAYNTEMDGFTITMTLVMNVNPGVLNSIRIGIADGSDSQYDSSVLIAADSVQASIVARPDYVEVRIGSTNTVDLLANDQSPVAGNSVLIITAINGIPVTVGSTVTLASGQVITLNADGTITVVADNNVEQVNFTYTVQSTSGNATSATGFVTLNQIPCFVAGTLIRTPLGEVSVETLRPGDLVHTLDDGPQPLRWIGRRSVEAIGTFAPIRIAAGTFGPHRTLLLSPQHRVLVRDGLAELLFGEQEVLVAAKDLVNGKSVTLRTGGMVEYVHLLFDRHQVVFSEGLATESYMPGPQTAHSFDEDIVAEISSLFPELNTLTGEGYSPSARRTLRSYEAQVLMRNPSKPNQTTAQAALTPPVRTNPVAAAAGPVDATRRGKAASRAPQAPEPEVARPLSTCAA